MQRSRRIRIRIEFAAVIMIYIKSTGVIVLSSSVLNTLAIFGAQREICVNPDFEPVHSNLVSSPLISIGSIAVVRHGLRAG